MFHGVTKMTDSPILFYSPKIQAYLCKNCCKQQCSKEALFWYNLNPQ